MFTLGLLLLATHPVGVLAFLVIAAASLGLIGMATSPVGPGNQIVTPVGAFTAQAAASLLAGPFVPIAASGAVNPQLPGKYVITKAGVAALTLAAPRLGIDDGILIQISSTTAFAHTVTATGLYADGGGHVNLATFAANIGATLILEAYQGKWYVMLQQGVTMT
jgi:hypothetical protein